MSNDERPTDATEWVIIWVLVAIMVIVAFLVALLFMGAAL